MLRALVRGLVVPTLLALAASWSPVAATAVPGQEGAAQERQATPQFGTAVEVLRIQVAVHDEDGDFVSGLGKDDFQLLLDGQPRQIVDVLEMSASRQAPAASAGAGAARLVSDTEPLPTGARRQFLILLDLLAPTFGGLRNARNAAVRFVDDVVDPDDRVGLAMYSARSGLEMVAPFTADHARVRQLLEDLSIGVSMRAVDPALAGIPVDEIASSLGGDTADLIREVENTRYSLAAEQMVVALQRLGQSLSVVQGRKDVLLFSTGLPDAVLGVAGFARVLERATTSLRTSDTVLHTLQPELMRGTQVHDVRNMQSTLNLNNISGSIGHLIVDRSFLSYLADETGGDSYWFRHNLNRGLSDIEEETRRYYVIAFQIRGEDPDVADLQVHAKRRGLVVRAPERLALTRTVGALSDIQRQLRVAEALELGTERDDLAVRMTGLPLPPERGLRPMAVALEVPSSELAALAGERGDGAVALEILGLAIDVDGGIHDVFRGTASSPARGIEGVPTFRYVNVIRVPPGAYHLKVLVREAGTDAMSVRSLRFDAPARPSAGVRLAGPLPVAPASVAPFVWGAASSSGASAVDLPGVPERTARPYPFRVGEVEVAPDLVDSVVRGESRDFYVAVDGLTPHPVTGAADWRLRVEAIGTGGRVREIPDAEVVLLDDADALAPRLVVRVPFPDFLAYGPNELRVRATDRISGASAEGEWSFSLLPG